MSYPRPYGASDDVRLYVRRDTMRPKFWRLAWWDGKSDSFVMAEGECSAQYHKTIVAARAYGAKHYGERAKYSRDFAN
jgi:hypothetical protein